MKAESLSPLATVATQTDPWSDDCRLSLFGDDIGADNLSDHTYQLYAPQYTLPGTVPLYDCIQHAAGDSESDDDGYDVIDDDCSNDSADVCDKSYRTNQPRSANMFNGITMVTSIPDIKHQPWVPLSKAPMFPFQDVTQRSFAGEIELVKEMAPVKSNHSVIRLGIESCRNRRVMPVELVDDIFSTHGVSASYACRSRMVPTMGTRLRATRLHTIPGVRLAEDRLCTTPPDNSVLDVCMLPGASSMSDSEQTSSLVVAPTSSPVAPSRQTKAWNSDVDAAAISFDQAPNACRSRVRVPAEVCTLQACDLREEQISIASHPIETTECCSPTLSVSSSDDVNKMSPTETRQSGIDDVDFEGTPSTRRRFIYEHYADVMYTNQANLAHTIMVQQRLFQQLLADAKPSETDCKQSSFELPLRTDCVLQSRRRYRSRPVEDEHTRDVGKDCRDSSCSKWVVRRRKDGTRYVTRSRHDNGEVKTEPRWRHHQIVAGDREPSQVDRTETDKQLHVNKHRRVATSGKDHGSPIAMSRDDRVNCADPASKTTMIKSGQLQHHPILAVVTI